MAPVTKKVRIEAPVDDRAQLKPSQVSQTSNIFGPSVDAGNDSEEDNADEEIDEELSTDDEGLDDEFNVDEASEGDEEEEDEDKDGSKADAPQGTKKRKKTDPTDFALAMQKILSSGLTSNNRKNPILVRSLESKKLDEAAEDERLESKVRKQMAVEKRLKLDKNHNTSVIGTTDEEVARSIEKERGMRKVAQRGVVRLFNAIRAAQMAAQDGEGGDERDERTGLRVRQGAGVKKREIKAQEMSKSSFLDLIKSGGRKSAAA